MRDVVANLFSRRQPARDAVYAVTRIMNRYDMVRLGFEEGYQPDRRRSDERALALGVWLFPCGPQTTASDIRFETGIPAVTHDLRSRGFGVMTPVQLQHTHFVVATPDEDETWKFFRTLVRHNTAKPGGWYHMGLEVERTLELDCAQRLAFRQHIEFVRSTTA